MALRKRAPASMSPAQARALIIAARSQFWPMPFVIEFGRFGGDRDLRGAGIGPQAQIDAKDVTVRSDFVQQLDQALDDVDGRAARDRLSCERKAFAS
jgi:hypothetical protein